MTLHSEELVGRLSEQAQQLRIEALKMVYRAQSGHLGGSFSAAEIMAAMYFHQLRIDPKEPDWPDRDRFIVSKGHCAPVYYTALAQAGFFPKEWLKSFRQIGSKLQGHPDRNKLPGVEMNSGPLGHGLSIGVGLALSGRLRGADYRTYVLLILDYNRVQLSGPVCDVMPLEPLTDKWRAFGWHVLEIDGHTMLEVLEALDAVSGIHCQPTMIIAHTVKGKGVSFMENDCAWHGGAPDKEQFERALSELQEGEAR